MPSVKLIDNDDTYTYFIERIDDKSNFAYEDEEQNVINIKVFMDGIELYKETKEYNLRLYLRDTPFIEIINNEGMIKFDAKVVEFYRNNDILVMRYLVEGQEKKIEIIY